MYQANCQIILWQVTGRITRAFLIFGALHEHVNVFIYQAYLLILGFGSDLVCSLCIIYQCPKSLQMPES